MCHYQGRGGGLGGSDLLPLHLPPSSSAAWLFSGRRRRGPAKILPHVRRPRPSPRSRYLTRLANLYALVIMERLALLENLVVVNLAFRISLEISFVLRLLCPLATAPVTLVTIWLCRCLLLEFWAGIPRPGCCSRGEGWAADIQSVLILAYSTVTIHFGGLCFVPRRGGG